MKDILRSTTALCAAAIVVVQPLSAQMTEIGEPEGELRIVAWPGYIERGETMAEFDWVTSFEEATGCMSGCRRRTPPTRWWR